jgi:hypothetical protein
MAQRMGFVEKIDIHTDRVISDLSHLGLYVNASVELRIGDRVVHSESIDPAMSALLSDIYSEVYNANDNVPGVGVLSRICLADSAGADRDCIALTGADITYDDPTLTLRVTKTINITSSYTAAYVILYHFTRRYFRTAISSTTVAPGDGVSVTWQATITATPSLSGVLSGADYNHRGLSRIILKALGGMRGPNEYAQPKRARYLASDGSTVLLEVTLTRDPNNLVASHPATNFTASGNWVYLEIYNPGGILLLRYALAQDILPMPVTPQDSVRYTFAGRWS